MQGSSWASRVTRSLFQGLSIPRQVALIGTALIIGIGIIAWMLIDQFGAASENGQRPLDLWWIVRLTAMSLAALTLCLALVWRLAQQFLASVDDVICALERVSMGDLSQRLDESGSVEVQRLASTFNLAVENFARRADDLKQSSLKRLQAAIDLRESRELATAIQETALDSIITIDSRGKILAFNAAAEATFGFKAAQAMGQELAELIVPERLREPYRRGLSHYLESGEGPILGKRVEMPALRAGGEEFPVEVAIVANQLRGSVCFTATIRDLTARKQAEEEPPALHVRQADRPAQPDAAARPSATSSGAGPPQSRAVRTHVSRLRSLQADQ
jgi:PAS domain S-box-containing protein